MGPEHIKSGLCDGCHFPSCKCHSDKPVEKPRCKKCNGPFQSHHKIWTVDNSEGFYHTGCRPPTKDPSWSTELSYCFKKGKEPDQATYERLNNLISLALTSERTRLINYIDDLTCADGFVGFTDEEWNGAKKILWLQKSDTETLIKGDLK